MQQLIQQNPYILFFLLIWATIWKGVVLYKTARREQISWFIIILLFNSAGILEILYILYFSKFDLGSKKLLILLRRLPFINHKDAKQRKE